MTSRSPSFSADEARDIARELYGFDAVADRLPSYYDQNFLLEDAAGRRRVLKIANGADDRDALDFQCLAMERVAEATEAFEISRVCLTSAGERIAVVNDGAGGRHHVRLLTYLEGTPWSGVVRRPPELLRDLGRMVAELSRSLEGFSHPAMSRFREWDLKNTVRLAEYLDELTGSRRREIVRRVLHRFTSFVAPRLADLPTSVIHGDVNNDNVLVEGGRVVGLIDFGDVVHSAAIFELAIAMGYAMLGSDEPLAAAGHALQGYQAVKPLTVGELDVVFDLARTRVAASVTYAAHYGRQDPDNTYLTTNVAMGWRVLEQLDDWESALEAVNRSRSEIDGFPEV